MQAADVLPVKCHHILRDEPKQNASTIKTRPSREGVTTQKDSLGRAIFSRSASDGLIGQTLEVEEERIPETHVALRHQHAGGIGLRTDPPMRAGKAPPLEFAGGIRGIERHRREGDGAAEAKA